MAYTTAAPDISESESDPFDMEESDIEMDIDD
jgi:hypothetical protein